MARGAVGLRVTRDELETDEGEDDRRERGGVR